MMHLRRFLFYLPLLLLLGVPVMAQKKWTVKEVPDPKAQPGFNYVSNPDGVLSSSTVDVINTTLKRLEDETTDQVAVVVLNSIGKKVPRDFAIELLRLWGVGRKDRNNGVLVLLVMDQRRMEFEVGYGLEGRLTDLTSKQIQEDYMIPYAKQGDYDAALLHGIEQVCSVLSGQPVETGSGETDFPVDAPVVAAPYSSSPNPGSGGSSGDLFTLYKKHVGWGGFWVLLFFVIFFVSGFAGLFKKRAKNDFFFSARPWWFPVLKPLCCYVGPALLLFVVAGVPINIFTGLAFFYLSGLAAISFTVFWLLRCLRREEQKGTEDDLLYLYARQLDQRWKQSSVAGKLFSFPLNRYRAEVRQYLVRLKQGMVISNAGKEMRLLSEVQDDAYLTKAQQLEEQLKSMDYDVWAEKDGKDFKLHGVLLSSKYSNCPKCNTMAYFMASDNTIEPATYSSSGVGVKIYNCKFCRYEQRNEYTIPRKSRESSSSGSSGGSWSSSGSSSSGSSWGGGSSGGGGAGSSW
ncbi:TPM domain-containing protein [Niabella beijingensis]|uniref:TPM domain-containing protein n=1 Tax=Niabella beijingensis TaxID=2872700 RepID=UPI001CBFB99C|nr:TPM domain-containing protein [Niabella beijingensis]MBZ4188688.1 TPM domain-containing protein [Niabella beijingensis]